MSTKDLAAAESKATDSPPKLKKSKSWHRIKGLVTGKSFRKKKEKKLAETSVSTTKEVNKESASPAVPTSVDGGRSDDESTIYGVHVDDQSIVSTQTGEPSRPSTRADSNVVPSSTYAEGLSAGNNQDTSTYILKIVLLLMDPTSRRFELLQLEFDSLKAIVSDVLAQIPLSVTEAGLRDQTYVGICSVGASQMTPNQLLADFCVGNEVLVAMQADMTPKECVRLARTILSDEKVVSMLKSAGIDASAWKLLRKTNKKKTNASATAKSIPESVPEASESEYDDVRIVEIPSGDKGMSEDQRGLAIVICFFLFIFSTVVIQVFHLYISTPIAPGSVVAPGTWLTKCGLFGFVNTECEDAFLHVEKHGRVVGYNAQNEVAWEIQGTECKIEDESCIRGMQVTKDNKIFIGGKRVTRVTKVGTNIALSPWPFEENPNLKTFLTKRKATK